MISFLLVSQAVARVDIATLQLGEEVAHALIRNLAGNDNIPDRNSIRGWAPSLWLGWVKICLLRGRAIMSALSQSGRSSKASKPADRRQQQPYRCGTI